MSDDERLTIGELASHTGVATSALRYWEEIGLLPAPARISGQRRYPSTTVRLVGEILVLQDVGYTLRELTTFLAARSRGDEWRELARRKIIELDDRIAKAQAARAALVHGLACKHDNLLDCPNYTGVAAARLAAASLAATHQHHHH